MSVPTLITERLILRPLEPRDATGIFSMRSDETVIRYTGLPAPYEHISEAEAYIERILRHHEQNDAYVWAITVPDDDNIRGTVCLWNFSEDMRQAELGYDLLPQYQGLGYAHEAACAVLEHGFQTLEFNEIVAVLNKNNERSVHLLEKLYFSRSPMIKYSLSKETWEFIPNNSQDTFA